MTLPAAGSVPDPAVERNLQRIRERFPLRSQDIANDAITAAQIATGAVGTSEIADGTVADTDLASPNNSVYRTLLDVDGTAGQAQVAATRFFTRGRDAATTVTLLQNGTDVVVNATSMPMVYLDSADYTVAGKTTNLRVRLQVGVNGTAPAITFTAGLYPITWSGAAGTVIPTLGTVVAGSNGAAIASPAINSKNTAVGADFAIPANDHYTIGIVYSGTVAVNSTLHLSAQLQMRHT